MQGTVMAFMFENLQVYQKAVDFADRIGSHTETFPRGYYFLVDQLNRAALSVATNLAEGNGRFTKPDRKNFFTITRGSIQECVPLIEIAKRRRFISQIDHTTLKAQLEEMAKMITGLINGLYNRKL
jgi:four helix bundle protein